MQSLLAAAAERIQVSMPIHTGASDPQLTLLDSKNTESLIKNLGKGDGADYSGCRECSICLGSVLVRPFVLSLLVFDANVTRDPAPIPVSFHGSLCPRLALQMHQSLAALPGLSHVPMSQLPCIHRPQR